MLRAAITFFIMGLVAFSFGLYDIAGVSMQVGKILLVVFLVFALIIYLAGLTMRNKTDEKKL